MPAVLKINRPVRNRLMIEDSFGTGADSPGGLRPSPRSMPSLVPRDGVPDRPHGEPCSAIVQRPRAAFKMVEAEQAAAEDRAHRTAACPGLLDADQHPSCERAALKTSETGKAR